MDQALTIVLPVYNFERKLRRSVLEVLELAHSFTRDFSLVIVDDGSADDTYETACELARTYPQMTVLRQPARQGLGKVLDTVRNNISADMVVLHDGTSPIDVDQLKALLTNQAQPAQPLREADTQGTSGSRRIGSLRALHDDMEHAHRRLIGFCWMKLEKPLTPRRYREQTPTVVLSSLGGPIASPLPVPMA